MSEPNLEALLRKMYETEVAAAPKQHPERTGNCPPLWRFSECVRKGWSPDERAHVSVCAYCQKVISMEWNAECPDLFTLAGYVADPDFPDKTAMEYHLNRSSCRCRLAPKSSVVMSLVKWIKALLPQAEQERGHRAMHSLSLYAALRDGTVRASEILEQKGRAWSVAAGAGQFAMAGEFAEEPQNRFRIREVSEDGSLDAVLEETEEGQLIATVESPNSEKAGHTVRVEVIGSRVREALVAEMVMEKRGDSGCRAGYTFGLVTQFQGLLADCALVAAWAEVFGLRMHESSRGKAPETVEAAIAFLANEPTQSKWGDRMKNWRDWLRNLASPLVAASPQFGFAAELLAEPQEKQVYDVILTADKPLWRVVIREEGEILAGVESWPQPGKPPLVVLVPEDEQKKPIIAVTSMDISSGRFVARFEQIAPGDYQICLEPPL